ALAADLPRVPTRWEDGGDRRRRLPRGGAARRGGRRGCLDPRLRNHALRVGRVDHVRGLARVLGLALRLPVARDRIRRRSWLGGRLSPPREHRAARARGGEPLRAEAATQRRYARSQSLRTVCPAGPWPAPPISARSSPIVPCRSATTSWAWMVPKLTWRERRKASSWSWGSSSRTLLG